MKKAILLFALCAQALLVQAQIFVEGVQLTPENTGQYIELDPIFKANGECALAVDYGQANPRQDYVTDANKKRFDFRSLVDGLNYFFANGWELAIVSTQESTGRRFFLKRRY